MSSLNLYALDREAFLLWLLEQGPTEHVGLACDDGACPLAVFLNQQYEGAGFLVNMTEYSRMMDDISLGVEPADVVLPLPEWAQDFVSLVDQFAGFQEGVSICARDALFLLGTASVMNGLIEDFLLLPLEVEHG